MRWNNHWAIEGKHAYLGASKYHWVNYDLEKMLRVFDNQFEAQLGTRKHIWAAEAIRLGIRQARSTKTLPSYINDAIGFRMEPEVILKFSDNCFGTADAISYEKGVLRIHDLKTGVHPGSEHQLEIYAALFCHEYRVSPYDIEMIFRIYQNDEILEFIGDPSWIKKIMDKMVQFDKAIEARKEVMM